MRRISPLNYIYAVGRVKALEKFLIPRGVFEEAIESNLDGALRLFVESNLYSDELLHIRDSQHLERILEEELLKIKKLISGLISDKRLLGFLELDTIRRAEDIVKTYPSGLLQDYLMHLVDMHNIKTFLRLYLLKEPQALLESLLVCEGFIKREVFLRLYSKDLAAFLNQLEYVHKHGQIVDYSYFLREAIEKAERENSFIALEKAINDFLIEALKQARYITFGPEPVIAYYLAKVNEINLLRMIIMAKLTGISEEVAKERLNNVYA